MRLHRLLSWAFAALAVGGCVVAAQASAKGSAARAAGSKASKAKPTLTLGLTTAPISYDPSKVDSDPFDETVMSLIYAPLIHQNPDGSFSPGLATSWRYVGKGNKTFRLTLRHNAAFSDGTPVTASAVKSWLLYFPKAKGSLSSMLAVNSISTSGKWTVTIHLKSANPLAATILSEAFVWGYVGSPKAVSNPSVFTHGGDGAGPYELESSATVSGNKYTFVPNPHYYDPSTVRFGKVVVEIISSPSSMLAAAQTGQVEVAQGDATTASAAKGNGLTVVAKPTGNAAFVFLDMTGKLVPALANVKVRQALNYAINRKAIAQALLGSYGQATSEYLTPDGFDTKYQDHYPYDPAKAKSLLAAAGYANGFSMNILSDTFEGTLGDPITQAVSQDLANVGVQAKVVGEPSASAYGSAIGSGTYPAFELDYGGDPSSLHYGFYLAPKAPFNQQGFDDPVLDKIWAAAQTATPAKAAADWLAMSDREVNQAEMLPVLETDSIWYVSKKIGGVNFSSSAVNPFPTEWFEK